MSRARRQQLLPLSREEREWLRLEIDQRRRQVVRRTDKIERAAKRRRKRDEKAETLLAWSRSLDERSGRTRS
jgi:hypothetical protein